MVAGLALMILHQDLVGVVVEGVKSVDAFVWQCSGTLSCTPLRVCLCVVVLFPPELSAVVACAACAAMIIPAPDLVGAVVRQASSVSMTLYGTTCFGAFM